jgi:hypothetical protein
MIHFWDRVVAPLVKALGPKAIFQVGGNDPGTTQKLIDAVELNDAVLHVATLNPQFDVDAARQRLRDRLVMHRARGLDVVPLLPTPDLILIDDDPNWYTLHSLLTATLRQARLCGRPFPVTALTQVGWPYARRDSYDEPSAIPSAFRQDYERAGIIPGRSALSANDGLFGDRNNAATENEFQSGVLTALQDFVEDQPGTFVTTMLPMFHGLALLHPADGAAERALQPILKSLTFGKTAAALMADLEAARVELEIERVSLRQMLAQAKFRNEAIHEALRAKQQVAAPVFSKGLGAAFRAFSDGRGAPIRARAHWQRLRSALVRRLRSLRSASISPPDVALLRATAIFDADWYLATYPDVGAIGIDPALHYLKYGWEEGRDPGPAFSSSFYLATYPDVAMAGLNPLLHYLATGASEGRDPSPTFRSRRYLETYPEVAAAGLNPLDHYLRNGRVGGRPPIELGAIPTV